jgi:hypothetical protein
MKNKILNWIDLKTIFNGLLIFGIITISPIIIGAIVMWFETEIHPMFLLAYVCLATGLIMGGLQIFRNIQFKSMVSDYDANIAELKKDCEIKIESLEHEIVKEIPKLIFYDNLNADWGNYRGGEVVQSKENWYSCGSSLKKCSGDDPSGGLKEIGQTINRGVCFSGWICRPSKMPLDANADRLDLEDKNHNGYGFVISHGSRIASIEIRETGNPGEVICNRERFKAPQDQWYHFMFSIQRDSELTLLIYDSKLGEPILSLSGIDTKYTEFDRIVIYGGYPYYIDELKIMSI